jgi:hydrogenase nickel incorporation protein HypA/HybF
MHEKALLDDLMRKLESVAREQNARRVRVVKVRLGALSHFTPDHFREHFADASRGGVAQDAQVEIAISSDLSDSGAQGIVLESVEVEDTA